MLITVFRQEQGTATGLPATIPESNSYYLVVSPPPTQSGTWGSALVVLRTHIRAPCPSSKDTTSAFSFPLHPWPPFAAACNGVIPSLSSAPTFAPCSEQHAVTTPTLPCCAATCNGVTLCPSRTFTSVPRSSNNRATSQNRGIFWDVHGNLATLRVMESGSHSSGR